MVSSLFDILKILGLLPFSGVILTVLCTMSMSFQVTSNASPRRAPVSFRTCRKVANGLLKPAMSSSISFSVGMNGSLCSGM